MSNGNALHPVLHLWVYEQKRTGAFASTKVGRLGQYFALRSRGRTAAALTLFDTLAELTLIAQR